MGYGTLWDSGIPHGSLNVPIEHHPSKIGVSSRKWPFFRVSNIPKMGTFTNPWIACCFSHVFLALFQADSKLRPEDLLNILYANLVLPATLFAAVQTADAARSVLRDGVVG